MRTLLLFLLFVIWEASADTPPPPAVVDPALGAMLLLIGYGTLIGVMRLWANRANRLDEPRRASRRVARFDIAMAFARAAVPAWFAVGIFALGWRNSVDHALVRLLGSWAGSPLVTPGAIVGVLPGIIGWTGLWWAQYPVERTARERSAMVMLDAALPVFTPPPFASYFANQLRVQVLFTTVPVVLILTLRDATNVAVRAASRAGRFHASWPPSTGVDYALDFGTVAVVLLLIPLVLRRVLSTRRLPDGRLREGLTKVLHLAGVKCRDVLLWDTHNNMGNAAVMGVLPAVRYVMLSDLLLETMTDEQVQAVFAHELGHVHHRHLSWFAGVIISAIAALSAVGDGLVALAHPTSTAAAIAWEAGTVAVILGLFWSGFGLLTRWFERQADVYAVRLMRQLGPTGDVAFISALQRVAIVNGVPIGARNWSHGSIASRVAYIGRLTDPTVSARFDRRGRQVRVGLWVLVIASIAIAAAGFALGNSASPAHPTVTATPN